tara:strand:- start:306 stop:509 length:204 start_codon:yes stop_codon:yes gene_type:complete
MSNFEWILFVTMGCILMYLQKVEEIYKFQENPQWYSVWKTMWLAAWVCMAVAILLMLFEEPNVRLGI